MIKKELLSYKFSKNCNIRSYYKNKITPVQRIEKKNILRNFKFLKSSAEIFSVNYYTQQLCFLNKTIKIAPITPFPPDPYFNDEATMFLLKLYIILEYENVYMYKISSDKTILYYKQCENNVIKFLYLKKNKDKVIQKLNENEWNILVDKLLESDYNTIQLINDYFWDKIEFSEPQFQKVLEKTIRNTKGKTADVVKNNAVETFFNEKMRKDPLYSQKVVDEYNKYYKSGNKKFDEIMETDEFKKFSTSVKRSRKKFKLNLYKVFGPRRNITYKCFKNILDEFREEYIKFRKTNEGKTFFNK